MQDPAVNDRITGVHTAYRTGQWLVGFPRKRTHNLNIISPHRMHNIDAGYCYRRHGVVCVRVCLALVVKWAQLRYCYHPLCLCCLLFLDTFHYVHHLGLYCILFRRFLISKINVVLQLTKLWLKKVTTLLLLLLLLLLANKNGWTDRGAVWGQSRVIGKWHF